MATRKTKRRAPSNASPKNTSRPGATDAQMAQSDPTKKPFTPEVLDKTVIAIPLLNKIKEKGQTKLQPIIIDVNLDYQGGREEAAKNGPATGSRRHHRTRDRSEKAKYKRGEEQT